MGLLLSSGECSVSKCLKISFPFSNKYGQSLIGHTKRTWCAVCSATKWPNILSGLLKIFTQPSIGHRNIEVALKSASECLSFRCSLIQSFLLSSNKRWHWQTGHSTSVLTPFIAEWTVFMCSARSAVSAIRLNSVLQLSTGHKNKVSLFLVTGCSIGKWWESSDEYSHRKSHLWTGHVAGRCWEHHWQDPGVCAESCNRAVPHEHMLAPKSSW